MKKAMIASMVGACNAARKDLLKGVIADNFMPLEDWGKLADIEIFLGTTVSFKQRCRLVWHWAASGGSPQLLVTWCKAQPGYLKHDKAANDIAELLTSWRDGKFEIPGNEKVAWSELLRQEVTVFTPTFASEKDPMRIVMLDEKAMLDRELRNTRVREIHEANNLHDQHVGLLAETADTLAEINGSVLPMGDLFKYSYEMAGCDYWNDPIKEMRAFAKTLPRKRDLKRAY